MVLRIEAQHDFDLGRNCDEIADGFDGSNAAANRNEKKRPRASSRGASSTVKPIEAVSGIGSGHNADQVGWIWSRRRYWFVSLLGTVNSSLHLDSSEAE